MSLDEAAAGPRNIVPVQWALTGLTVAAMLLAWRLAEMLFPVMMGAGLLALAAIWLAERWARVGVAAVSLLIWAGSGIGSQTTGGRVSAVVGGLAAAVVVIRGRDWPGWSDRYQRTGASPGADAPSPRQMWESLDRGEDPTRRDDLAD